jgi:DNA-directed RNA polymerase sigma subunit (sigma70/sigma32)
VNDSHEKFDRQRLEKLRASMSVAEIEDLQTRARKGTKSLTLDEVGILFLLTRARIREIEEKARRESEP